MAIVKILARHSPSYASLVRYVMRYVVDEDKTGHAPVYTNNLRSNDIRGYVSEFIENEALRRYSRVDQVRMYHEIVSWKTQPDAPISGAMIDDLVRKYMELRGPTGVMLGAVHRDKARTVHVHFVVSALHFRTGRSFGMSKAQLYELKTKFQDYQRTHYPELTESLPQHGKGREYASHAQWHAKQREQIIETVRQCFAQAKSQKGFLELLRDRELHHYERNGKPTGIMYEGQKFRLSRLLESGRFDELPIEQSEEEIALSETRAIRQRQLELDERSIELEDRER